MMSASGQTLAAASATPDEGPLMNSASGMIQVERRKSLRHHGFTNRLFHQ